MVETEAHATDLLLARRACDGDVEAFEQLYHGSVGRVHALCLRMSGDPALAEELTQEAFVRAWTKLSTFKGKSAFSTWMHRLAVNVMLGHGRRLASSRQDQARPLDEVAAPVGDSGPGRRDASLDLERAIAGLPERAREVFVLHDVEGYRHHEIASLTGVAVGTSKAQLHRARGLLRKALRS